MFWQLHKRRDLERRIEIMQIQGPLVCFLLLAAQFGYAQEKARSLEDYFPQASSIMRIVPASCLARRRSLHSWWRRMWVAAGVLATMIAIGGTINAQVTSESLQNRLSHAIELEKSKD